TIIDVIEICMPQPASRQLDLIIETRCVSQLEDHTGSVQPNRRWSALKTRFHNQNVIASDNKACESECGADVTATQNTAATRATVLITNSMLPTSLSWSVSIGIDSFSYGLRVIICRCQCLV